MFCLGGFWQGGFLSRGFLSGGLCPGGFCPGVFCPRTKQNDSSLFSFREATTAEIIKIIKAICYRNWYYTTQIGSNVVRRNSRATNKTD